MSHKNNPYAGAAYQADQAVGVNIDVEDVGSDPEAGVVPDMTDEMTADMIGEEQLARLCQDKVCPDCRLLAQAQDEKLRMAADVENMKKRLQREKDDFCKFATESVLEDLLPVLDNLDLALEHGGKTGTGKDLLSGVEMTRKLFLDILGRHELEPLGLAGEDFDPAWHEALAQQPHPDFGPGKICQVVQKGYRLKGRLLRPAKVLVSMECAA